MQSILTKSLCKSFDGGENYALSELNLTVPKGKTLALAGAIGAGKTTLLRILAAKLVPSQGHAFVIGFNTAKLSRTARKGFLQKVVLVEKKIPPLSNKSVKSFVLEARRSRLPLIQRIFFVQKKLDVQKTQQVMNWMGLNHLANTSIEKISPEAQIRARIARGIVRLPYLLLIDDLWENQDLETRKSHWKMLKSAQEFMNNTVVFATQDTSHSLAFADLYVCLDRGRIIRTGNSRQFETDSSTLSGLTSVPSFDSHQNGVELSP